MNQSGIGIKIKDPKSNSSEGGSSKIFIWISAVCFFLQIVFILLRYFDIPLFFRG